MSHVSDWIRYMPKIRAIVWRVGRNGPAEWVAPVVAWEGPEIAGVSPVSAVPDFEGDVGEVVCRCPGNEVGCANSENRGIIWSEERLEDGGRLGGRLCDCRGDGVEIVNEQEWYKIEARNRRTKRSCTHS